MHLLALTFLTPLLSLIGAAVAVPALLLFYFLKLRRRPLRVSSTMLWDRAVQDLQVNAPFRWLRASWLLFLQLALLALLLLALGRPAIEADALPAERYIILIDHSASMQALDGATAAGDARRTRLDEARARARAVIDRVAGEAEVQVVTFAATARTIQNFSRSRATLHRALETIEPTDQPADLAAAIKVLEAFVAETGEEEQQTPPRIILISDGNVISQRTGFAAAIGAAEFTWLRVGPEADEPADNLGIVAFSARRDYEDPAVVRAFTRIIGASPQPLDFVLAASLDGAPVGRFPLRTAPVGEGDMTEIAWTFELEHTGAGVLLVQIEREDVLASDNAAALHLLRPASVRTLLVRPEAAESSIADEFLAAALSTLDGVTLHEITATRFADLTRAEMESWDLLVLDRVRPDLLPRIPTISFGATLPVAGLSVEPVADDTASGRPTGFAFWQRTHPVMRYVGLNPVVIFRPMRLTLPDADAAAGAPFRITELATGPEQPLIVLLERDGIRRIVVGFELGASSWWRDPSFPVFMSQAVTYLTLSGDDGAGRSIDTTTPVVVRAAPGAEELRVRGPVEMSRTVAPDSAGRVSLGVLPRAGVYDVEGAASDDALVCVNLVNEGESRVSVARALEVAGRETTASATGRAAPREIWHWFVAAALALLAVEWCLFAWRMRV